MSDRVVGLRSLVGCVRSLVCLLVGHGAWMDVYDDGFSILSLFLSYSSCRMGGRAAVLGMLGLDMLKDADLAVRLIECNFALARALSVIHFGDG